MNSVDQKLLKTTKFPPDFNKKVDMQKVNVDVIKKWIATKISEILNEEDDVVIELCFNLLEGSRFPNIKVLQIQLTGFLEKDTVSFCRTLWDLCLSAQENSQGIPKQLLEAKKQELLREKIEAEKATLEARILKDAEEKRKQELEAIREKEKIEKIGQAQNALEVEEATQIEKAVLAKNIKKTGDHDFSPNNIGILGAAKNENKFNSSQSLGGLDRKNNSKSVAQEKINGSILGQHQSSLVWQRNTSDEQGKSSCFQEKFRNHRPHSGLTRDVPYRARGAGDSYVPNPFPNERGWEHAQDRRSPSAEISRNQEHFRMKSNINRSRSPRLSPVQTHSNTLSDRHGQEKFNAEIQQRVDEEQNRRKRHSSLHHQSRGEFHDSSREKKYDSRPSPDTRARDRSSTHDRFHKKHQHRRSPDMFTNHRSSKKHARHRSSERHARHRSPERHVRHRSSERRAREMSSERYESLHPRHHQHNYGHDETSIDGSSVDSETLPQKYSTLPRPRFGGRSLSRERCRVRPHVNRRIDDFRHDGRRHNREYVSDYDHHTRLNNNPVDFRHEHEKSQRAHNSASNEKSKRDKRHKRTRSRSSESACDSDFLSHSHSRSRSRSKNRISRKSHHLSRRHGSSRSPCRSRDRKQSAIECRNGPDRTKYHSRRHDATLDN